MQDVGTLSFLSLSYSNISIHICIHFPYNGRIQFNFIFFVLTECVFFRDDISPIDVKLSKLLFERRKNSYLFDYVFKEITIWKQN